MQHFIIRRLLLAVVTLLGVSWLIFAIMWMIPGDVAVSILGDGANPERIAALREQMGLNDPWYVQYGRWAKDIVRGDLGTSLFIANKPVKDLIAEHLPITVNLAVYTMTVAVIVGVTLGTISGIWHDTVLDYVCRALIAKANFLSEAKTVLGHYWRARQQFHQAPPRSSDSFRRRHFARGVQHRGAARFAQV